MSAIDTHDYSYHVVNQATRNDHPQYQLVAGLPTAVVQSLTAGAGLSVTGGDGSGHGALTAAIAVDGTLADIKAVGQAAAVGSATVAPAADHVHQGVTSITAGSGITVTGGDGSGHGAVTIADLLAGAGFQAVQTLETTTATAYGNLTTSGPAVTVTTGANAIVAVGFLGSNSVAGDGSLMSFAISGATTAAASNNNAAQSNNTQNTSVCCVSGVSGLTAGSNTFTAKYDVTAGTGTFARRWIVVIPLP